MWNEYRASGALGTWEAGPAAGAGWRLTLNGCLHHGGGLTVTLGDCKRAAQRAEQRAYRDAEAAALREDAGMTTSPDRCPADGAR